MNLRRSADIPVRSNVHLAEYPGPVCGGLECRELLRTGMSALRRRFMLAISERGTRL